MKVSGSCAAVAALAATTNARHLIRSEPTVAVSLADNGVSPRPTDGPDYDLLRRADDTGTLLYAPDNTCGFISGLEGAGYTCFGTYTCAFTISGDQGHVGCCESGVCNYRYKCVDFDGYFSSSLCNDGCEVDILTLKCTDTSAPYCNTISFDNGVSDYWCNTLDKSTAQMATTTFSGGDARVYTTLDETSTIVSSSSSSETTESSSSTVPSDSTSTGPSASASTSSGSDGGGGSSTPIGPIVGGVVGGVGALALAGAAIFFCLRSKKKKEAAAAPATNTTPPAYQAPNMQQQPGVGPNGYNPVPQGQTGYYDPKQAYATPNQQYNQAAFYPAHNQPGSPDFNQTNPSSPGTFVDPRMAQSSTSPSPSYNQQIPGQQGYQPGYQPQQAVIHEAPANAVGSNGRGDTHELA
ncbi:hypothetical protein B0J13DRAFT_222817 [Dactylonectria estremocensis]|uniref:Uncharacterized protein n=1 Tax=Dactylonectria estremocensis TaxID=1079267 RepID=A0A9P9F7Y8_9HYPO|nr:hypothetical protein B0J13DRAFT_222817 [Dactylonectria estremocensis]